MHDGRRNTYHIKKDGKKFNLHPLCEQEEKDGRVNVRLNLGICKGSRVA